MEWAIGLLGAPKERNPFSSMQTIDHVAMDLGSQASNGLSRRFNRIADVLPAPLNGIGRALLNSSHSDRIYVLYNYARLPDSNGQFNRWDFHCWRHVVQRRARTESNIAALNYQLFMSCSWPDVCTRSSVGLSLFRPAMHMMCCAVLFV